MSWLPRLSLTGWCTLEADDSEYEGRCLQIRWHGLVVEIAIGRREDRHAR